jgi:hypothetical protein
MRIFRLAVLVISVPQTKIYYFAHALSIHVLKIRDQSIKEIGAYATPDVAIGPGMLPFTSFLRYTCTNMYEWVENLPENCPPQSAGSPQGDFFRVISAFPPDNSDFNSTRQDNPLKLFAIDECLVRSCSIFSDYAEGKKLLKLPRHRNKIIIRLSLTADSGLVLRTFERPGHYSWWRDRRFPLANHIHAIGDTAI